MLCGQLRRLLRCHLLLQIGQRLVLQVDQPLQFSNILFQYRQTFLCFLQRTILGNQVFFAWPTRFFITCTGDFHLIAVSILGRRFFFNSGFELADLPGIRLASGLLACRCLCGCRRQFLSISLPIRDLCMENLFGFCGRNRGGAGRVGHVQNRPRLEAIEVLPHKGFTIGPV